MSISTIVVMQPRLLPVADASVDEATAQRLRALLIALWREHPLTVLMATHNVQEAVQLADESCS